MPCAAAGLDPEGLWLGEVSQEETPPGMTSLTCGPGQNWMRKYRAGGHALSPQLQSLERTRIEKGRSQGEMAEEKGK